MRTLTWVWAGVIPLVLGSGCRDTGGGDPTQAPTSPTEVVGETSPPEATAATTEAPTGEPTPAPTDEPSAPPTDGPTDTAQTETPELPTAEPSAPPTDAPTSDQATDTPPLPTLPTSPTPGGPTPTPEAPTEPGGTSTPDAATATPGDPSTAAPTLGPTPAPTAEPTTEPTDPPTAEPTAEPTPAPTPTPIPDRDNDGAPDVSDCAPDDPSVHPGAAEVCDGQDQDCDGEPDDGLELTAWYADRDNDGFGDDGEVALTCDGAPEGHVGQGGDCAPNNPDVHPEAQEVCNDIDDDCDGAGDDGLEFVVVYPDGDGDGYGLSGEALSTCLGSLPGTASVGDDCDDEDELIHPGADELCNGLDDNCDGDVDAPDPVDGQVYYQDGDGDGFGDSGAAVVACAAPSGYVEFAGDCDDDASGTVPGTSSCPFDTDHPSCLAILQAGESYGDGIYDLITPDGPLTALCDMTSDGGGWTLIFSDDFEGGVDSRWSYKSTYVCGAWSTLLGGYGLTAGTSFYIDLPSLGVPHTHKRVELTYVKLDSWDGEAGWVEIDAARVWQANLYYYTGSEMCGWNRGWEGSYDERNFVDASTPNTATTTRLKVGSNLNQDPGDESFGIDDVYLWVR